MRNCKAFTLIEAMLTMAVFLLTLTVIGALVSFGVRNSLRQNSQSDSRRNLLIQASILSDKTRLSAQSSLTLHRPTSNQDLYLSMAVPIDGQGSLVRDSSGQPVFQNYWIWYHPQASKGLFLTERAVTAPSVSAPPPLTPAEVLSAVTTKPGHMVVSDLTAFEALDLFSGVPLSGPQPGLMLRFGLAPANAPPMVFTQAVRFMR